MFHCDRLGESFRDLEFFEVSVDICIEVDLATLHELHHCSPGYQL